MNENLAKIIKLYSIGTHTEFNAELINRSKDNLIELFSDLLTIYINDKNSSTIREFLTCVIAGYKHSNKKIGFNGFKQNSLGEVIGAEVKPQNFSTHDLQDFIEGNRKAKPKKLNASGNFSDYTWERFYRNQHQNLNILFSGFLDGKLIYIIELPYDDKLFLSKIEQQLKKRFPNQHDIPGEYLRRANFSFTDIKDSKNLKVIWQVNFDEITKYKEYLSKDIFCFLNKGDK